MNEHDDDLESTVHEGADAETDCYPNTGDELDEPIGDSELEEDEPRLDKDEAEL